MFSWVLVLSMLRPGKVLLKEVFRRAAGQMRGSLLAGVFVFALAYIFNYSGVADSLDSVGAEAGSRLLPRRPAPGEPQPDRRATQSRSSGYPGYKASNPVISADGRFMAFQMARVGDPAGVGRGIFVYDFAKAPGSRR